MCSPLFHISVAVSTACSTAVSIDVSIVVSVDVSIDIELGGGDAAAAVQDTGDTVVNAYFVGTVFW